MFRYLIKRVSVIASILVISCSQTPPRLTDSDINNKFVPYSTFADYIEQKRNILLAARIDLTDTNRATVLAQNLPFEVQPARDCYRDGKAGKALLWIHGLYSSPYEARSIAQHLSGQCFLVRVLLLPGHGTRPGDLLTTDLSAWQQEVSFALNKLKHKAHKLYLGGYSMGAALAVEQMLIRDDIHAGLLFAPSFKINSAFIAFIQYIKYFKTWLQTADDEITVRYESLTMHSGVQTYKLSQRLEDIFATGTKLKQPVFMALSDTDTTTDNAYTLEVFNHYITNPGSKLLLYARQPPVAAVDAARIIHANSYFPQQQILSLTHVSLLVPATDAVYGKDGSYKNCVHYSQASDEYTQCQKQSDYLGEVTSEHLSQGVVRRLNYNPSFKNMLKVLDKFIDSVDGKQ
jgi:esterase/lipase